MMSNWLFRFGIPPAPASRLITNVWFDPMQPVLVTISSVPLLLTCGFYLSLFADEKPPAESSANAFNIPVDYVKDVRPILRAKCAMCHNEAEPSGGLRLDGVAHVMKGGDSGPVLIPGHSTESRLIQAVVQAGDLKMPPPEVAEFDANRQFVSGMDHPQPTLFIHSPPPLLAMLP